MVYRNDRRRTDCFNREYQQPNYSVENRRGYSYQRDFNVPYRDKRRNSQSRKDNEYLPPRKVTSSNNDRNSFRNVRITISNPKERYRKERRPAEFDENERRYSNHVSNRDQEWGQYNSYEEKVGKCRSRAGNERYGDFQDGKSDYRDNEKYYEYDKNNNILGRDSYREERPCEYTLTHRNDMYDCFRDETNQTSRTSRDFRNVYDSQKRFKDDEHNDNHFRNKAENVFKELKGSYEGSRYEDKNINRKSFDNGLCGRIDDRLEFNEECFHKESETSVQLKRSDLSLDFDVHRENSYTSNYEEFSKQSFNDASEFVDVKMRRRVTSSSHEDDDTINICDDKHQITSLDYSSHVDYNGRLVRSKEIFQNADEDYLNYDVRRRIATQYLRKFSDRNNNSARYKHRDEDKEYTERLHDEIMRYKTNELAPSRYDDICKSEFRSYTNLNADSQIMCDSNSNGGGRDTSPYKQEFQKQTRHYHHDSAENYFSRELDSDYKGVSHDVCKINLSNRSRSNSFNKYSAIDDVGLNQIQSHKQERFNVELRTIPKYLPISYDKSIHAFSLSTEAVINAKHGFFDRGCSSNMVVHKRAKYFREKSEDFTRSVEEFVVKNEDLSAKYFDDIDSFTDRDYVKHIERIKRENCNTYFDSLSESGLLVYPDQTSSKQSETDREEQKNIVAKKPAARYGEMETKTHTDTVETRWGNRRSSKLSDQHRYSSSKRKDLEFTSSSVSVEEKSSVTRKGTANYEEIKIKTRNTTREGRLENQRCSELPNKIEYIYGDCKRKELGKYTLGKESRRINSPPRHILSPNKRRKSVSPVKKFERKDIKQMLIDAGDASVSKYKKGKKAATLLMSKLLPLYQPYSPVQYVVPYNVALANQNAPVIVVNRYSIQPTSAWVSSPNLTGERLMETNVKLVNQLSQPKKCTSALKIKKASPLPATKTSTNSASNTLISSSQTKQNGKNVRKPWFDKECSDLRKKRQEKMASLYRAQKSSNSQKTKNISVIKEQLRRMNRGYVSLLRKRKKEYFDQLEREGKQEDICKSVLDSVVKKVILREKHEEKNGDVEGAPKLAYNVCTKTDSDNVIVINSSCEED